MKRLIAPLLAFSLLASGLAVAAPQDPPRNSDRNHQDDHRDQHGQQQRQPPRKGERLAQDRRGERVDDYGRHGLKRPPKGHEWRKVDDRYVLIAVATGIVTSVIANGR
ncbi:RcnB family protein [Stenotrophomonas sp. MMGLT7]|uniref:RcnB family protein n=1 Tax=Stenotrophomonas sp. MMGLT7 TaxID=2901227 RepID=UPI001E3A352C|nr:RcnB family protein [Stenotrophomonas sp. MMGLT7]MCD7098957.1 RcnB family protein [Stenotrophomonas sp. MMGLT7]